ncbi:hypothetical protein RN001_001636 [Aquatica leii]|uniref:DUF4806 domain-containing protein n=1 Tax=Aquatica leii TaxID=1421715 RepID=A0AAN7QAJ1_9COLE|nr:hypothetical protein RN001_001636 [Aquatica leii]
MKLVILLCCVCAVWSRLEQIQLNLNIHERDCTVELYGMEIEVRYFNNRYLPENNDIVNNIVKCSWKKDGLINENNEIMHEKLKQFIIDKFRVSGQCSYFLALLVSGDYETAYKKLQLFQSISDIGTDVEVEDQIPAKRVRRATRTLFEDISDDDSASPSQLVRPLRILADRITDVTRRHFADDGDSYILPSSEKIISNPSTAILNRVNLTPTAVTPSTSYAVEPDFVKSNVTPRNRISKLLIERKRKLHKCSTSISRLQSETPRGSLVALDILVQFPISIIEDINLLETHLLERQNVIVLSDYLSTLEGRDIPTKANEILKTTVSNILASEFLFFGSRSEKSAFRNLSLKAAIVEAVKKDTPGSTDTTIKDYIKVWLKHALKRFKAETNRR